MVKLHGCGRPKRAANHNILQGSEYGKEEEEEVEEGGKPANNIKKKIDTKNGQ